MTYTLAKGVTNQTAPSKRSTRYAFFAVAFAASVGFAAYNGGTVHGDFLIHGAAPTPSARLVTYANNQRGFIGGVGNKFKASLWFTSADGTLDQDQLESALKSARCTATTVGGDAIVGSFVAPKHHTDHPFFEEKNFGVEISYAPGWCSFDKAANISAEAKATVEVAPYGKIELTLSALPKEPLSGVAVCHPALRAKSDRSLGPGVHKIYAKGQSPSSLTYGAQAMHNVNYYAHAAKPSEKPIRTYLFDSRDQDVREQDPLSKTASFLQSESLKTIELTIPLRPSRETVSSGEVPLQPDTVAQFAWLRECGDMVKYDGYKWVSFSDFDEYVSVPGGKSIQEYLDSLTHGTISVIAPRIDSPHQGQMKLKDTQREYVPTHQLLDNQLQHRLLPVPPCHPEPIDLVKLIDVDDLVPGTCSRSRARTSTPLKRTTSRKSSQATTTTRANIS